MFQCANGACIPISLYCDFTDHCGDRSDESACSKISIVSLMNIYHITNNKNSVTICKVKVIQRQILTHNTILWKCILNKFVPLLQFLKPVEMTSSHARAGSALMLHFYVTLFWTAKMGQMKMNTLVVS